MERLERTIEQAVYSCIMGQGEFIIPDIVAATGLSSTTVAKYIDMLIAAGKIEARSVLETGNRGRKPVVYGAKDDGKFFLGIDIQKESIFTRLISFSGKQHGDINEYPYQYENSASKLEEICQTIEEFLEENGVTRQNVLGSCVVIGGRVNSLKGTSASLFLFEELGDTPLADYLAERLGFPVMIENDTKAMTSAEYETMENKPSNMLFINFSWGIGLGIVIDGQVYHGRGGYAGEFGHIHSSENNIVCQCGKRGCFETEVSGSAIQRKLTERIRNGERGLLSAKVRKGETITMKDLIRACNKEDEMCIDQITKTGAELGVKLSDLINIFNPEMIVIGGILSKAVSYYLLSPIESSIRKYSLKIISKGVSVVPSALGIESGVIGGCLLARNRYLTAEAR